MGDDLPGIVCHIVGCHGGGTGEDEEAEAENGAQGDHGEDRGEGRTVLELDREHD
jgi:hypothetical protein